MSEDTPPDKACAAGFSCAPASPCLRRKASTSSGSEALNGPAVADAAVEQPVVQPVLAALPELDLRGDHAIAAPVRRAGRVLTELLCYFLHFRFKKLPARNHRALRRGVSRQASARRPGGEVIVRLGARDLLDASLDADLPLELRPQERQAGRRP